MGKFQTIEVQYVQQEIEEWSKIERSWKKHKVFGSVMCWHCTKDGRYAPGCPCKDYDHGARRKTQTKKKRMTQDSQKKPCNSENTAYVKDVKNIEEKNASQKSKDGDDESSVYTQKNPIFAKKDRNQVIFLGAEKQGTTLINAPKGRQSLKELK